MKAESTPGPQGPQPQPRDGVAMAGTSRHIAVIGMAGRFPGAASVADLWRALCAGERCIRGFDESEAAAAVPGSLLSHPDFVRSGAPLADADRFDAGFFGIPAGEARLIDPQQRVFLECAWQAMEDAGHAPGQFAGPIGVYGSVSLSTYLLHVIAGQLALPADGISYPVLMGNDKDFLCSRVSHRLGLTGPSMVIQSACSSSLVAVHVAVQALLAGECDVALAGGVSITFPQQAGYLYREGGILSHDGHCRVFDAAANGTVKGDGCAVVVLRRLDDAERDRDDIKAVIRGTAVNNDGASKIGFTAPSAAGQAAAIRDALAFAGVPAADIGYVEAHGTGTTLGDPIEVRALAAAHAADGCPPAGCDLGSIKANLGHLDAAAGVTGLIKTVLVLREQLIPAQVDFARPNPRLLRYMGRYRVNPRTHRPAKPLRAAAVSSFALGGTNAHVVLTPPASLPRPAPAGRYLILLSARDEAALTELVASMRDHVAEHPGIRLDDVAFTLLAGRSRYPARAAFAAASHAELLGQLTAYGQTPMPEDLPGAARSWLGGDEPRPAEVGDLEHARRVCLPGHPLRPERHWIEPAVPAPQPAGESAGPASVASHAPGDVATLAGTARTLTARLLDLPAIGDDEDIYDLGMDSMGTVELVTALRDATGLELHFEEFDGLRTVREIAALLAERSRPPRAAEEQPPSGLEPPGWTQQRDRRYEHLLTKIKDGDDRRTFLVHAAGGSIVTYVDLARHITDPAALWAIDFPGAEPGRFHTLRDLARLYLGLVRGEQPHGPYRLGGYSFGGSVAFEMAAMLEAQGEKVERLLLFDSHPPEAYIGGSAGEGEFLAAFPALIAAIMPGQCAPGASHVPATLDEALALVRRPGWPASMEAEVSEFFGIWRRNHEMLKRWYPDQRVDADLTVLAATEPEDATVLDRLSIRWLPRETWGSHAGGTVTVVPVPGNHYSMFRDPAHLAALGAAYDAVMAEDMGDGAPVLDAEGRD